MGTLGVEVSPSEEQSIYNQSDRLEVNFSLKFSCCQFSGCQTLVNKEKRNEIVRCTWEGWCHSGTPPYQGARRRPFLDEPLTSLFAAASAPRCSPLQNDYNCSALIFLVDKISPTVEWGFQGQKSQKYTQYTIST